MTAHTVFDMLLPKPSSVRPNSDRFELNDSTVCFHSGSRSIDAATCLSEMISREFGVKLRLRAGDGNRHALRLQNRNDTDSPLPTVAADFRSDSDEASRLDANRDGAVVTARTSRGLMWGAMTLRQLVTRSDTRVFLHGATINDAPRYAWRGFQIDCGRSPNSIPQIKRIIRICSAFKLNFFIFREGDDELNAVRYKSNPLGSENPHAFTLDELADLSQYAARHGIALVPEVESLGHSTAKALHYPDLVSGGFEERYEGIGSHTRKSHLQPCDPRTFRLLESIYDDLFGALHQPLIHLGLDEVRLAPEIQKRHLESLLPIVLDCGRRHGLDVSPIVWSDAPPTPDKYRGRVIRCMWEYADGRPIGLDNEHLARQGIEELSAPGCREQTFMAGGSSSRHIPYSKSACADAFRNLSAWSRWGERRDNYAGLFAVQWSGNMIDDWLPDFLAAADFGWTPPETQNIDEIQRRIDTHLARLADFVSPDPQEIDRHAWDAIWLKDRNWHEEVLPRRR